jgi:hypothetical protein
VEFPSEAAVRVVDQWAEALKLNAQRIDEKRRSRVPNEQTFQNRLAAPSSIGYQPIISPTAYTRSGADKDGIVSGQAANFMRSFKKFSRGWAYMFETVEGVPAKRFKEMVDLAKSDFSEGLASRTLPFTGTKIEGRGPAAIAALWLTCDPTTEDQLRAGDIVLEGGPILISPHPKKPGLKAALTQRLVQAGARIIKSNYNPTVITAQNQLTAEEVQGYVDPALDLIPFTGAGDSHVDYIRESNSLLYLEIKVSKM